MGCASSAYSKSATSDTLSKPHRVTSTNSIPTDEVVLKDLPEVVEKVIDVIKESDAETADKILETNLKAENSSSEIILNGTLLPDTDSESSLHGYVQGFLADNESINLSEAVQEDVENFKSEVNGLPVYRDSDSLGTSSPESEIELALANSNDINPPTPKPTLSELQDLYTFPTTNFDYEIKPNSPSKDNNKIIQSINTSQITPIVLSEPTDWEKQADMLATTRKYNPIEAMRKLKRESTRASSSLPHRDFRPRSQHYIEEGLNEFFSQAQTQSPLHSSISSAKSGRGGLTVPPITDADVVPVTNETDHSNKKTQNVIIKKQDGTPNKRKEQHLTVTKNGKRSSSPSNFKVRERCAVCCNKYKT